MPSSQITPAGPNKTPNSTSVPPIPIIFPMAQNNPMSLWSMPPAVITPELLMTPISSLPLQYLNSIMFQTPAISENGIWNVLNIPQASGIFQPIYNMMNATVQMQPASPKMNSNSKKSALKEPSDETKYVYTKEQKAKMEDWFDKQNQLRITKWDRSQLSEEMGIPEKKIRTWVKRHREKLAMMRKMKQATAPAQKQ